MVYINKYHCVYENVNNNSSWPIMKTILFTDKQYPKETVFECYYRSMHRHLEGNRIAINHQNFLPRPLIDHIAASAYGPVLKFYYTFGGYSDTNFKVDNATEWLSSSKTPR